MNEYEWKDNENETLYYFNTANGRIVGQVHKITHTKIWLAKINTKIHAEELYLGQYISCDFAMKSVEEYMAIQDRTLLE